MNTALQPMEFTPEQALAPVTAPAPATPLDLPAETFQRALERRKANRQVLLEWIKSTLVNGVDFGIIHTLGKTRCKFANEGRAHECPNRRHWSKPSLFKPGAEKICGMLGVTVHYPTLKDYEQAVLAGVDLRVIILRCELRDAGGRVVAEGTGARVLAKDDGDINKSLKMAEKSAHIDATLRMAGLSEMFTQDLEDLKGQDRESRNRNAQASGAPSPVSTEGQDDTQAEGGHARETMEQRADRLFASAAAQGTDALAEVWNTLDGPTRRQLVFYKDRYKTLALQADEDRARREAEAKDDEARAEREAIQAEGQDDGTQRDEGEKAAFAPTDQAGTEPKADAKVPARRRTAAKGKGEGRGKGKISAAPKPPSQTGLEAPATLPAVTGHGPALSKGELKLLQARMKELSLDPAWVEERVRKVWGSDLKDLPQERFKDLYDRLAHWARPLQAKAAAGANDPGRDPEPGAADRQRAADLLEQAAKCRRRAEHADGQAYYRDLEEARRLEAEAKRLLTP